MTIPGRGDLVPRRHRAPIARGLVTALVLVLLGAGGYFAFLGLTGGTSSNQPGALQTHCPKPTVVGPQRASTVHLVVNNATARNGLAALVSGELKSRGFHVSEIGNTKTLSGIATVRYRHGELHQAQAVADQIRGTRLVKTKVSGVELDLGKGFHALRSRGAAGAARARLVAAESNAVVASTDPGCS